MAAVLSDNTTRVFDEIIRHGWHDDLPPVPPEDDGKGGGGGGEPNYRLMLLIMTFFLGVAFVVFVYLLAMNPLIWAIITLLMWGPIYLKLLRNLRR